MKILIVEDDKSLNNGIALSLNTYECEQAYSLAEAWAALNNLISLIILDINLPDGNGMDFCREVRRTSNVPIIFLTANDMEIDIVSGFETGADDYITKPFSLAVLRARVNAVLRRGTADNDIFRINNMAFDFDKMEFFAGGRQIELSRTEQKLLKIFVKNIGITLSRETLIDRIWTDGAEFVEDNALSVTVNRLREKLPDAPSGRFTVSDIFGRNDMEIILIPIIILLIFLMIFIYLRTSKILKRVEEMLDHAITGSFSETEFSETRLSRIEEKMKQYLMTERVLQDKITKERNSVQTLVSDISHQTKTPISNISLYAELLGEKHLEAGPQELLKNIKNQTDKLNFLIQSLVKISRLENGIINTEPAENNVKDIFNSIDYKKSAEEKGVTLTCAEISDMTAVFDLKWTAEAISNIIDNAIKYTPPGGLVTVSVLEYEMFIRIDISDTGIGMTEEETAKIFARFYRSPRVHDDCGVGIGLYLARKIISRQGGYIKVKSEIEKGSTFSVFLPKK